MWKGNDHITYQHRAMGVGSWWIPVWGVRGWGMGRTGVLGAYGESRALKNTKLLKKIYIYIYTYSFFFIFVV